jgi:hypothetical protein
LSNHITNFPTFRFFASSAAQCNKSIHSRQINAQLCRRFSAQVELRRGGALSEGHFKNIPVPLPAVPDIPSTTLNISVQSYRHDFHWQDNDFPIIYTIFKPRDKPIIAQFLCLPAFSVVSSRKEFNSVAVSLANMGCEVVTLDWMCFGDSLPRDKARFHISPSQFRAPQFIAFLKQFISNHYLRTKTYSSKPIDPSAILHNNSAINNAGNSGNNASAPATLANKLNILASGHSFGYIAGLVEQQPLLFNKLIALSPTFRSPLAVQSKLDVSWISEIIQRIVYIFDSLWRKFTTPERIVKSLDAHVYSAEKINKKLDYEKLYQQKIAGLHHYHMMGGISYVSGVMDITHKLRTFTSLFYGVKKENILIIRGTDTPKKSYEIMKEIEQQLNVRGVEIEKGKLLLHEEFPEQVSKIVADFCGLNNNSKAGSSSDSVQSRNK